MVILALACGPSGVETGIGGPWDCAALPTAPFEQESFPAIANEDITFDASGNLVGADVFSNLWRTDLSGASSIVLPSSGVTAGLRLMPWDGTLASAQYATNAIYRIDPISGARELLVAGLSTPSGIEIGPDESIWFGELNGDRIQRYHVPTGTLFVVAEGLLRPNGLTFNRDFDQLYVAATDESRIYVIDIDPVSFEAVGEPRVFAENAGEGIDGLEVDACGNVYAAWWSQARIDRYGPDGSGPEPIAFFPEANFALGNFAWGDVTHGWDPETIFIVETGLGTVRSLRLGVGGKTRSATAR